MMERRGGESDGTRVKRDSVVGLGKKKKKKSSGKTKVGVKIGSGAFEGQDRR